MLSNNLTDYYVNYFNSTVTGNGPGASSYGGLMVYNTKGKNFVILVENQYQSLITSANYAYFGAPGTVPNINNFNSTGSITYPELPTFVNGFNGYNIPLNILNINVGEYTFYIID